jgi:hypothetical protein
VESSLKSLLQFATSILVCIALVITVEEHEKVSAVI